jgi:hypothetical protein
MASFRPRLTEVLAQNDSGAVCEIDGSARGAKGTMGSYRDTILNYTVTKTGACSPTASHRKLWHLNPRRDNRLRFPVPSEYISGALTSVRHESGTKARDTSSLGFADAWIDHAERARFEELLCQLL